jgi:cell division protein ZapA
MAEVALPVGGRVYPIACRDGEEEHLRALAARVDSKTVEAKAAVGDTGEARLLLLSALLLADELIEADAAKPTATASLPTDDTELERLAVRLEALAHSLEQRG